MKAGLYFTGSGPILAVTSCEGLVDSRIVQRLEHKRINKFIVFELPLASVQRKYGSHFEAVLHDNKQADELRVVDSDGHHAFYNFAFEEFGPPVYFEGQSVRS